MQTGFHALVAFVSVVLVFSSGTSAFVPPPAGAAEFFVAPDGSDTNPGTADRPFATLDRAKKTVEEQAAGGLDANLTVWIREGTYTLSKPLVFGQENG